MDVYNLIATDLQIKPSQVKQTINLLQQGNTIPFISRYRKEATGELNELQIEEIKQQNEKYIQLSKRKEYIINTLSSLGKLTEELSLRINKCFNLTELEDIYLPYKQKKVTRAEIARKKGLLKLSQIILAQNVGNLSNIANQFINKDVNNIEDALKGARDIIAEQVNEDEKVRKIVRQQFSKSATIISKVIKGKEDEGIKYSDYFSFCEPLKNISSHRLLAIRRGEKEGILRVTITPDEEYCQRQIQREFIKSNNDCSTQIKLAIEDSFKRLLKPAIENEFSQLSKDTADKTAIKIFVKNLQQLLLAPPLGQKNILGIDPGFRTGCKTVCISSEGSFEHYTTIYPHAPHNKMEEAKKTIVSLVKDYKIQAIAIGNGTAGKETENFIKSLSLPSEIDVYSVSEDGASIYSASKIAREEFPDFDVTVRGAISIARRLQDPLAELVKIEPKSIGVGQYQHDVDQTLLKESLNQTVENCVNNVGVNLNTASKHILTYISGLGPTLAQNIIDYRHENGPFKSRKDLKKVARMGEKTFEQCAGFLRIPNSKNALDNSGIHPESYSVVEKMAKDLNCTTSDLINSKEVRDKIDINKYVTSQIGIPTLTDIMKELDKPGRDPRLQRRKSNSNNNINSISEIKEGMTLFGIVDNITDFGCFVNLGIKEKGLVHISQMAETYVKEPHQIVSINQEISVKVMSIDLERKRIQLTMKGINQKK